MANKLTLRPEDRIVFHPGLEIKNTTKSKIITFELPSFLDVTEEKVELIDVTLISTPPQSEEEK